MDISKLFIDPFVHLGADEVNFECWRLSEKLAKWMEEMGLEDYQDVLQYYISRVSTLASSHGKPVLFSRVYLLFFLVTNCLLYDFSFFLSWKKVIFWQEVFNEGLVVDKDTVIQVWLDFETLSRIIQAGHRAILSNYQAWLTSITLYSIRKKQARQPVAFD